MSPPSDDGLYVNLLKSEFKVTSRMIKLLINPQRVKVKESFGKFFVCIGGGGDFLSYFPYVCCCSSHSQATSRTLQNFQ